MYVQAEHALLVLYDRQYRVRGFDYFYLKDIPLLISPMGQTEISMIKN